jgi:hypothetical protein
LQCAAGRPRGSLPWEEFAVILPNTDTEIGIGDG